MAGGLIGRITGLDELRREMRQRTEELKKASESWVTTAVQLEKADRELAKALREHKRVIEQMTEVLGKL